MLDDLSLGLSLANDWTSWEVRAPSQLFETTLVSGVRPEAALLLRYFIGIGFYATLAAGGDVVVLTESVEGPPDCVPGVSCAPVALDQGVLGLRGFAGLDLGFRTDVADDLLVGVAVAWRWVPLFNVQNEAVRQLPSYTDASWMANLGFNLTWNL